MTNEEKIKSLSTEELADMLGSLSTDCEECLIRKFCADNCSTIKCETVWKQGLKSEVQNNDISKS